MNSVIAPPHERRAADEEGEPGDDPGGAVCGGVADGGTFSADRRERKDDGDQNAEDASCDCGEPPVLGDGLHVSSCSSWSMSDGVVYSVPSYSSRWGSVSVPMAYSSSRNVTASPGVLGGWVLRVRRRARPAPRGVCRVARYRWGRSCRSNASRSVLLVSSGGRQGGAHDLHALVAVRFQAVGGEVARPEPDRVVRVERRQNF